MKNDFDVSKEIFPTADRAIILKNYANALGFTWFSSGISKKSSLCWRSSLFSRSAFNWHPFPNASASSVWFIFVASIGLCLFVAVYVGFQ